MKQWKIALSLAVVAAVEAPFVSGSWKVRPTKEFLVPLTPDQKEKITAYMEKTSNCESERSGWKNICEMQRRDLERGAESYHGGFSVEQYLVSNFAVALGVFVCCLWAGVLNSCDSSRFSAMAQHLIALGRVLLRSRCPTLAQSPVR